MRQENNKFESLTDSERKDKLLTDIYQPKDN